MAWLGHRILQDMQAALEELSYCHAVRILIRYGYVPTNLNFLQIDSRLRVVWRT